MLRGLRGPLIYAEKHVLLRQILMIVLFAVICSAFWYSFEDTFKGVRKSKTYFDETKSTTKDEMAQLNMLMQCMQDTWDIQTIVHIRNGAVYIPSIQKNTLFIGVSPMPGQTVIIFPPVMRKMFSRKTIQTIESGLDQCTQLKSNLSQCVLNTLDTIHEMLGENSAELKQYHEY